MLAKEITITKSSMPPYEEYIEAIKPLWDTHWLTNMGCYHAKLEQELKEYLGVEHLSLMVNGHMALELTIQAYDFPLGAEIITTPFTFISTTHAIVRNGLQPVFCDVKLEDGTIDENKIEDLITDKTVAILPVHIYGHVCNVEKIQEIADKYSLRVIYDAAHAFGVRYKGRGIGSYGDASVFSFHATKIFHTIEGGAVAFREPALYNKLYNLKNFGIQGEELVVEVGANAKMNEFSAIMGLCNLKYIKSAIEDRRKSTEIYQKVLSKIKGIELLDMSSETKWNFSYMPIIVGDDFPLSRNLLYDKMLEEGVHCRKYFYPITADQACFKNQYQNVLLENARYLADRILVLPLYEGLEEANMEKILSVLEGSC